MATALIRSALIARLAEALPQMPVSQVEAAVKCLLDTLSDTLAAGERVEIRGFGSFSLHVRSSRLARNPRTGEPVVMGKRRQPHFKPGKELRNRVDLARHGEWDSRARPAAKE
jgi:integration host factor subunit beta